MYTFKIPRSSARVSILQQRMKLLQLTQGQPTSEERNKLSTVFPMAAHIDAIDRNANMAYISVNLQNIRISDPAKPLYEDVNGNVPAGHDLLDDVDMGDQFLPDAHEQETHRAYQLSKKPIANAPPYGTEPPWEEMGDITIEELIIYFPNHVLRWPALALILRLYKWDQLFHRTTRFINIARGSGYYDKGQKHAEVLPCMMKVERAIQEIEPRYQLADHEMWVPEIDQAWLKRSLKLVPKTLKGKQLRKLPLEEVASYVEHHEFADRPFSKRARHALDPYIPCTSSPKYPQSLSHPLVGILFGVSYPFAGLLRSHHFAPAPTTPVKEEVDINMDAWSNSSYDAETEDNTQTEDGGLVGHRDSKSTNERSETVNFGANALGPTANSDTRKAISRMLDGSKGNRETRRKIKCDTTICNIQSSRVLKPTLEVGQTTLREKKDLKSSKCPAAPPNAKIDTSSGCKWGVRCTSKKCTRSHLSPATVDGQKANSEHRKGSAGQGNTSKEPEGG
ncbi:hypothetical protein BCR34DRAFT_590288 [Clohesyomyces aquaticus]|uniref:Uncharacterized protein n=1 Tax=Clohesyomyces aquaticus TaxID=1231657 RepID=A0A1Y1ZC56_9PLEO|nr:hypothetical protein BCR34DRAFT_590288 [Clohesyomyces aquaticus]